MLFALVQMLARALAKRYLSAYMVPSAPGTYAAGVQVTVVAKVRARPRLMVSNGCLRERCPGALQRPVLDVPETWCGLRRFMNSPTNEVVMDGLYHTTL